MRAFFLPRRPSARSVAEKHRIITNVQKWWQPNHADQSSSTMAAEYKQVFVKVFGAMPLIELGYRRVRWPGYGLRSSWRCKEPQRNYWPRTTKELPTVQLIPIHKVLRLVGLEHTLDILPSQLSAGIIRHMSIARALNNQPPIVLYSSPTASFNQLTRERSSRLFFACATSSAFRRCSRRNVYKMALRSRTFVETPRIQTGCAQRIQRKCGRRNQMAATRFLVLRDGGVYFEGGQEELADTKDEYLKRFLVWIGVVGWTIEREGRKMAQRKQLTWMELRVGLFVLVGLAVLAAGIFFVTGAESFGPKYGSSPICLTFPDSCTELRCDWTAWKLGTSKPLSWRLTFEARCGRKRKHRSRDASQQAVWQRHSYGFRRR